MPPRLPRPYVSSRPPFAMPEAAPSQFESDRLPAPRVLAGGFLMGLANLVPGVSGGTMILALGLYDAFIGAVAEITSFRWSRKLFVFLALIFVGLVIAIGGLAPVAVMLVSEYRWIMYSLFIGMTLGGVPELLKMARPFTPGVWAALLLGLGAMAFFAYGSASGALEENFLTLVLVGALAASSMILPGVSGSYILLILGFYETVWGAMSPRQVLEDPMGSAGVVVPIVLGSVVGIGLLSNALKLFLEKKRAVAHGLLLGLLFGSVFGLWPFQEAVHPELVEKDYAKAVMMLVQGEGAAAIEERRGVTFEEAERQALLERFDSVNAVKRASLATERRAPQATQAGLAVLLLVGGFGLTRLLGVRESGA